MSGDFCPSVFGLVAFCSTTPDLFTAHAVSDLRKSYNTKINLFEHK